MIDKILTGRNIAAFRMRHHLSQTELAEHVHVTPQAVSKWENGVSLPDLESLLSLSYLFQVSMNDLLEDNPLYYLPPELRSISGFFVCPYCGQPLTSKPGSVITFHCREHHEVARYIDGILCFSVSEGFGNEWSKVFRNYDEYLNFRSKPLNANYSRGIDSQSIVWDVLSQRKPKIIVDIASGEARGIEHYLHKIYWDCTIVLTDLSYRILKWDRQYFEHGNPHVTFVYLACDCSHLPLQNNCADAVVSYGGYENMDDACWDGLRESYRILRPQGTVAFNPSTVHDRSSANSAKWLSLTRSISWISDKEVDEQFLEVDEWLQFLTSCGFRNLQATRLYDELPAPQTDVFPFSNAIMQWMCEYVIVGEK